ncbi:MAG: SDR family NAD(P)-dependent oxidoreductase [Pirellulaceae bacterium]
MNSTPEATSQVKNQPNSQVAIVTGSASGIGRATALELATRGFDLVLHTRSNLRGLQSLADSIGNLGRETLAVTGDIRFRRTCHSIVDTAFAWKGSHVQVLVNNAGADVLTDGGAKLSFSEKLYLLMDVDVAGTIHMSRRFVDCIAHESNSPAISHAASPKTGLPGIVNIGWDQSQTGMEGTPGQLFCTTKAAVEAFSHSLALTTRGEVKVNVVAPGWIRTKWSGEASEYWDARARSESLMDRWGTPEDVAKTIGWLCSPQAEFVNDQVIAINGGLTTKSSST